jgi:hypothetical protein
MTERNVVKNKAMRLRVAVALLAMAAGTGASAQGSERAQIESMRNTTLSLIKLLVAEGVLSQDKANALVREAEAAGQAAAAQAATESRSVRVPYVPEVVKEELRQQIREEVFAQARAERWAAPNAVPSWADRVSFYGDVRFRYQADMLDKNNATPALFQLLGQNVNNTQEDRSRLRVRARLGLVARISDTVEGGIQLATGSVGSTGSPISTNNTLGDYFNRQSAGIDLAYVKYMPAQWLDLIGGRMRNPFLSTDLIFAPDLNFDGVFASVKPRIAEDLYGFLSTGAFPLNEFEPNPASPRRKNKWMFGTQIGLDYKTPEDSSYKVGLAFYQYKNIEGVPNNDAANPNLWDWTAPQFRQKGNSMFQINLAGQPTAVGLASRFSLVNLTAMAEWANFDPIRVGVQGDYVRNSGFDRGEIERRTLRAVSLQPRTLAWQTRLNVGHKRFERFGDWSAFGAYRYVERDALLDAFTDGDFFLGGTNAKGYVAGLNFAVARDSWFGTKYATGNQIDGLRLRIDVFQVDFNMRF